MTADELSALEAAVSAMTPGPWRECRAQPDGRCACGLVWCIPHDIIVATVKPSHCDGCSSGNGRDAVGIAALRNAAPALISRVMALEAALREALKRWSLFAVGPAEHDAYERARSLLSPPEPAKGGTP